MAKAKINWQAAHRRTEELRSKLHRDVRPQDIVKDATNPQSPYHEYFVWDDAKAGPKYRLQQARALLANLKIIYHDAEGNEVSVRKYVRVQLSTPADHELKSGYVPRLKVLKTPQLRLQVVAMAKTVLESFKTRFRMFTEIEMTYAHIDAAIQMLSGVKVKTKRKAQ